MILIIRISGQVNIPVETSETLFRIKLRRKYSAVLIENTKANLKLLQKIRNYVAYGEINKETLEKLKELRDKKKGFFRLHPPRKGIESKKHYGVGKGVLGDNKIGINDLVARML